MKNLFIMHTQYNLILACSLVLTKYKGQTNDLILHAEFELKKPLYDNLKAIFNKITVVQSKYYKHKNYISDELHIYELLKKSQEYSGSKYDAVFLSQENYWDTLVLSKLSTKIIYNIEEDIYFPYTLSLPKDSAIKILLKKLRNLARYFVFGKNFYYRDVTFYGENEMYSGYFSLFPHNVRREIQKKHKKLFNISHESFVNGIEALYRNIHIDFERSKYIVIFSDLIERYPDKVMVERNMKNIIDLGIKSGYEILIKYHPRETNKILIDNIHIKELDSLIPAEKILVSLMRKKTIVIGNITTALNTSAKLGIKTISIIDLLKINNESAKM